MNVAQDALPNVEGTLWENLSPWGMSDRGVLECTSVDLEELQRQWQIAMAPPAIARPPVRRYRGAIQDYKLLQMLMISVKSSRLTPELVTRALTEDFDLLNREQAMALGADSNSLARLVTSTDAGAQLRAFVQMNGVAALEPEEAVLWAIENVPAGGLLAEFAWTRLSLQDEVSMVTESLERTTSVVQDIGCSLALRTLLQTTLVVANTLSQQGHAGYKVKFFLELSNRRLSAEGSSILAIVARSLEVTHERRCRLRFLRMLAVGRSPIPHSSMRRVWSYLDDLQESPWDAVPLLHRCQGCRFDELQDLLQVELWTVKGLQRRLLQYQNVRQPTTSSRQVPIHRQIEELTDAVDRAEWKLNTLQGELREASRRVVTLLGSPLPRGGTNAAQGNAQLTTARDALQSLSVLGSRLQGEMNKIVRRRGIQDAGPYQRGGRWGTWERVDTDGMVLQATSDLDLLRALRRFPLPHDNAAATNAPTTGANSGETEKTVQSIDRHHHLMHGGQDGEYRRDPESGRWVPVGATAAMVARDRGDRGAVAGWFATY